MHKPFIVNTPPMGWNSWNTFYDQINEDLITLDAELSSDLGINSIELADLVMICEEKFDLTIEDEDLHSFITVGDVLNYLEAQD